MAVALRADLLDDGEKERRRLLEEADGVLDAVEVLRLEDRTALPPSLAVAVESLQRRLGRRVAAPRTLAAAHRLVLALESRLMSSNPRAKAALAHPERGGGQPIVTLLPGGTRWKVLAMPAPTGLPPDEWRELVDATVERAWDRWAYAQEHAVRAARAGRPFRRALRQERMAWQNYSELSREAERLRRQARRAARP